MTTRPPRLADWPERHARWPQRAPSRSSGRRSRGPAARLHEAACVSAALGASPRRPTHPASCWHSSRGGDAAAAALCPRRRRAVPHACRLLCLELIVLIRPPHCSCRLSREWASTEDVRLYLTAGDRGVWLSGFHAAHVPCSATVCIHTLRVALCGGGACGMKLSAPFFIKKTNKQTCCASYVKVLW